MNQANEATPLQRALVAVKDMRARLEAVEAARREPIAIIGLACRLPGAVSPQAFWQQLHGGVDAIRPVPAERWNVDACFDARPGTPGKMYTRDGGFLDNVDRFDAAFFRISPREAISLDPQQRLLLEVAWEAFERAGLTLHDLAASQTGVFVGITTNDYAQLLRRGGDAYLDSYFATGNALNAAAGRLAYFFGLHGPCMAIDSACSSSLTALHLACQSLRAHESDLALVGGVNLILTPDAYIAMCQARTIAPDGRCKTFDARADGYVRGEGCVALVLKRLYDAERDGDPIQALIRGSAVQQDGHSGGLTVPNGAAQQVLLRRALANAGVAPAQVSYVEAHGTGTTLGDPIEIHALGAVLGENRPPEHPLLIGAVKTNIGHLEAAAGLAGVLKTTLALQQHTIPPHLHLCRVNPDIDLAAIPAAIPTVPTPWHNGQGPRIAGVTAMGLSGTIAHVVLQEAPPRGHSDAAPRSPANGEAHLLLLSARSEPALRRLVEAYHTLLSAPDAPSLADVCHLAATRRTPLEQRLAVTSQSREEMCARLVAFSSGQARSGISTGQVTAAQAPRLVFVFPGQGSQWAGMGQALLVNEPVFREAIEACDAALRPFVAFSLVDLLSHPERAAWLEDIATVQPALFAMQVGLAALWRSWGVEPDAVIGHSMGEVAAATVAGALSLADAARIISRRSQIMQRLCGQGAMILVERSPAEAEALLAGYEDRVAIAVCNSPRSTVLAGDPPALHEIVQQLTEENVFCRWVKVDVASHSPQIDRLHDELVHALADIDARPATISLYSTVTAGECAGEGLTTSYWLDNLRQPVRFAETVQKQLADGHNLFLEISPHPILLPAIEQNGRHVGRPAAVAPSLRREVDPAVTLREAAGILFTAGCELAWHKILPWSGTWVDLPTYPWQRERFWPDATAGQPAAPALRTQAGTVDALLGTRVYSPVSTDLTYEASFSVQTLPFLADHRIEGQVVVPGAAHLARVLAAAHALYPTAAWRLEDVTFPQALILDEQAARLVQLILDPTDDHTFKFQVFSRAAAAAEPVWTLHALGTLIVDSKPSGLVAPEPLPADTSRTEGSAGATFYQAMWDAGYHLGPTFRWIEQFWAGEGGARARMADVRTLAGAASYPVFPGLLDACFQLVAVTSSAAGVTSLVDSGEIYVPVGVTHLHVPGPVRDAAWCQVQVAPDTIPGQPDVQARIVLTADDGRTLLDAGFRGRRVARRSFLQHEARVREEWFYRLAWVPLEEGGTPGSNAENAESPAEPTQRWDPTCGTPAAGTPAWLIFADGRGVADALATRLAADNTPCILVESGPEYAANTPDRFVVPPADADAYRQLLADLDRHYPDRSWSRIVHLWSLDAGGDTPVATLQLAQDLGCLSVVGLVQALARRNWLALPHLCLMTRGAQPVEQPVTLDGLAQAPLWGLARSLFLEHHELPCTCIDVGAMETSEDIETLYQALRAPGTENQLALRGRRRYAARLLPCTAELPNATNPIRAAATYLITGGLGGLGLVLAQALVAQGARRLVLMGRRPPSGAAEAVLAALRAAGAEVLVQAGDVTQPADVAAAIDLCHQPQAPLRGVIHAALVLDDGMLLNLDAARVRRVLAPKVDGAWHLHQGTQDLPLDFFVLFSSATGILGSPGQAPYAAGSAFLDALAHHRQAAGLPGLSIDWGPWSQVGQAAAQANRGERLAARGFESLAPAAGLAALQRVWGSAWPQVAIMALNAGQWDTVYPQASTWPLLSQLPRRHAPNLTGFALASAAPLRDVLLATPPGWQRRAGLETHLREQIAHVLRQDPSRIDAQTPLMQFGFDSLMALELRNRLEVSLGLTLSATLIWTYPTIASLAPFLADKMLIPLDSGVEEPEPAPAALADLSTDDVAALLAQELATLKQRKAR